MSRVRRAKCKEGEDCQFCGCCATASGWECGSRRNGMEIWQSDGCQANELEAEIQRKEDLLREVHQMFGAVERHFTSDSFVRLSRRIAKELFTKEVR